MLSRGETFNTVKAFVFIVLDLYMCGGMHMPVQVSEEASGTRSTGDGGPSYQMWALGTESESPGEQCTLLTSDLSPAPHLNILERRSKLSELMVCLPSLANDWNYRPDSLRKYLVDVPGIWLSYDS